MYIGTNFACDCLLWSQKRASSLCTEVMIGVSGTQWRNNKEWLINLIACRTGWPSELTDTSLQYITPKTHAVLAYFVLVLLYYAWEYVHTICLPTYLDHMLALGWMYIKMNGNPPQPNATNSKPCANFSEQLPQFYVHVDTLRCTWQGNINMVLKHIENIMYLTHLVVPGMVKII